MYPVEFRSVRSVMTRARQAFAMVVGVIAGGASAQTLVGDTVQYELLTAGNNVFASGTAVVGNGVEFVVNAAGDLGFNSGQIAVDVTASGIVFQGPTTPNSFRYGYETIRIFSLDFQPSSQIGGIVPTVNLSDPLGLSVSFGPHEVDLHLGNSLWVPAAGGYVAVAITPVPEPSSVALFTLGVGVVGAWRARQAARRLRSVRKRRQDQAVVLPA
jgi:hypothetical protein